jgi:uncharacterized protein
MKTLNVTPIFVGALALIQVVLTTLVIRRRVRAGVALQDGGDNALLRRIRAHGNFTETVPIALLAMLIVEMGGLASAWLWLGGAALVIARLIHAAGIIGASLAGRRVGIGFTLVVLIAFGLIAIGQRI